jgi:hypothetical protein
MKMSKKFKDILMAALVGASVTFLTHLLEALVGLQGNMIAPAVGGTASSLAYFIKTLDHIV